MSLETILARRSIRKYQNRPVSQELLEALLRAAMSAPSAGNAQPWHFVVLTERSLLEAIPAFHPYAAMVADAPAAVLVCGDPSLERYPGFWPQDCSASVENLLIAAQAQGLGAVWVGVYPVEERIKAFRNLLGIPDHVIPFALVPVGYPAEEKPPADRYQPDRIHRERWV